MTPTRRHLLRLAGAGLAWPLAATTLAAPAVIGRAKGKVVIVGGGAGGATLARALQQDASDAIAATLVEPQTSYITCFFSNLVIGGFRTLASITQSYDKLRQQGVVVAAATAASIDRDKKDVILGPGVRLPYDRLVLAPGVDLNYESVPGYSEAAAAIMPHAWKTGAQADLLARKLNALDDGDTIVVVAPPNPARCPPAVYERVSMFAHVLKGKGHTKCRIIVLDTKPSFPLQPIFQEAWEKYFPGMIEWQDPQMHGGIKHVDAKTGDVVTDLATYKAALANIIPAQVAGSIARDAGLADTTGFCPIDADSMKSSIDRNIFVLGDAASAGEMPKSAFSAASQAKVAAQVIRREFANARPAPAHYATACWSLVETDDGVKIGGTYASRGGRIRQVTSVLSQPGEGADVRKTNYRDSLAWYDGMVADMFG